MKQYKKILLFVFTICTFSGFSQKLEDTTVEEESFWKRVRFGGGIQLSIGSSYTTIGVSPSAIYEVSDKFAAGLGVSYLYSKHKLNDIQYNVYGASILGLYNPIKEFQLSTEFEQLNVVQKYDNTKDSYWLPAWYLGAAYSMGRRAAVGIRYDVLYDEEKSIYDSAFTPFVRIYF